MATREIPVEEYKDEEVQNFLSELSALTKKFGIAIHGCGHCGSPIIYGLKNSQSLPYGFGYENLKIDENTCCYTVKDVTSVWM